MQATEPKNLRYQAVLDNLCHAFSNGEFIPGSPFMSLDSIVRRYGVSEITARRVVRELAAAGYIECSRGRKPMVCDYNYRAQQEKRIAVIGRFFRLSDDYRRGPWNYHYCSSIQMALLENHLIPIHQETSEVDPLQQTKLPNISGALYLINSSTSIDVLTIEAKQPVAFANSFLGGDVPYNGFSFNYDIVSEAIAESFLKSNVKSILNINILAHAKDNRWQKIFSTFEKSGRIAPQNIKMYSMDWDGEKQSAKDIFAGFIRSGLPRPLGILVPVWLAYEALMICGEYGLKPGKDFRLVCCSGIPARELLLPGVSGVEMPFETLSSSISGYFYNVLNSNSEAIVPSVKIPVKFIELDT